MKDFAGNELKIGDTVAVIYHPKAYQFSIEIAVITGVSGKKNMITTQLSNLNKPARYMPDSEEKYQRLVKISPVIPCPEETDNHDAIGRVIRVGDRIACRRPTEAGGNTVKGFETGGIVTKITEQFAFYLDDATGQTKRKGLNGVVVY